MEDPANGVSKGTRRAHVACLPSREAGLRRRCLGVHTDQDAVPQAPGRWVLTSSCPRASCSAQPRPSFRQWTCSARISRLQQLSLNTCEDGRGGSGASAPHAAAWDSADHWVTSGKPPYGAAEQEGPPSLPVYKQREKLPPPRHSLFILFF